MPASSHDAAVAPPDPLAGQLDGRSLRWLALLQVVVGCIALVTAGIVFAGGWIVGADALEHSLRSSGMKGNTAIGIGCLGAALAVIRFDGRYRRIAYALAGVAVLIALVTLGEYAFQWKSGIDQLWIRAVAASPGAAPGRPAALTAVMILLLGAALLCTGRASLAWAKTAAALLALGLAWAILTGYVFGPQALREVLLLKAVAVQTAGLTLLLGLGVLATQPPSWPIRTVLARGTGGVICRWLLPMAILAPPLLGWLLTRERSVEFFPAQFGWALYSALSTLGSVWLILTLAHRISIIDIERQSAAELSRHDPLTGLANRRAFDAFLMESFSLSRRHGHTLSLLLVDIDHFKSYNDAFGHPAGDVLLQNLSAILASVARETDLVARLGGEEFGIILPETGAEGARVLGERIRAEVSQATQFRRQVTVSVGVSTLAAGMRAPSELIEDCDSALYRAKSGGRNRVWTNRTGPSACAPDAGAPSGNGMG